MSRPYQNSTSAVLQLSLLLAAVGLLAAVTGAAAAVEIPACRGKKIGVVNLSKLAEEHGELTCIPEEVIKVDQGSGVVYYANATFSGITWAPHHLGTHAGPWFVTQAIRSSHWFTPHWEDADVVYVDDYCYYIWWLASVHTLGRQDPTSWTPGVPMVSLYRHLIATDRWRRNGGADFVFFHSHPGFVNGAAEWPYYNTICDDFANATMFVAENEQRSRWCKNFASQRTISTPYVPNALPGAPFPGSAWTKPPNSLADRDIFLFSSARCGDDNIGKRMRSQVSRTLEPAGKDVEVSCTNEPVGRMGGQHVPFSTMLDHMSRSKFCLALVGDAASTRRLSEIFMAGCVPVFVGPPYNTAPFADAINWPDASLWFNVSEFGRWMEGPFHWSFGREGWQYEEPRGPQWWFPEAHIPATNMYQVETVEDIVPILRSISSPDLERLLFHVERYRHMFLFRQRAHRRASAVTTILSLMCGAEGFEEDNVVDEADDDSLRRHAGGSPNDAWLAQGRDGGSSCVGDDLSQRRGSGGRGTMKGDGAPTWDDKTLLQQEIRAEDENA